MNAEMANIIHTELKLDILRLESRQTVIKCAGSLERRDKRLINQGSDVPRIIFFFAISYRLGALKTFYLYN